jgi:hypothetical protein
MKSKLFFAFFLFASFAAQRGLAVETQPKNQVSSSASNRCGIIMGLLGNAGLAVVPLSPMAGATLLTLQKKADPDLCKQFVREFARLGADNLEKPWILREVMQRMPSSFNQARKSN